MAVQGRAGNARQVSERSTVLVTSLLPQQKLAEIWKLSCGRKKNYTGQWCSIKRAELWKESGHHILFWTIPHLVILFISCWKLRVCCCTPEAPQSSRKEKTLRKRIKSPSELAQRHEWFSQGLFRDLNDKFYKRRVITTCHHLKWVVHPMCTFALRCGWRIWSWCFRFFKNSFPLLHLNLAKTTIAHCLLPYAGACG